MGSLLFGLPKMLCALRKFVPKSFLCPKWFKTRTTGYKAGWMGQSNQYGSDSPFHTGEVWRCFVCLALGLSPQSLGLPHVSVYTKGLRQRGTVRFALWLVHIFIWSQGLVTWTVHTRGLAQFLGTSPREQSLHRIQTMGQVAWSALATRFLGR